jgi:hypothetical protein
MLRRVSTGMVLVDEIHRLDLTTKRGKDASDQLKYFFERYLQPVGCISR